MRVDGGDAQIDNLKMRLRITRRQQGFQVTARAVGRLRITHRGGLAQDENSVGVGGLVYRHADRSQTARQLRRKKPEAEGFVVNEILAVADGDFLEQPRIVAVAAQSQSDLGHGQQNQWDKHLRDQTEQPLAGRRWWRLDTAWAGRTT